MGFFDEPNDPFGVENDDLGIAMLSDTLSDPITQSLLFSDADSCSGLTDSFTDDLGINPANGLPMVGACDIEGNLYGTNFDDDWMGSSSHSLFDDD